MAWIPQTSRSHFLYGAGSWSKYYWDSTYNPAATSELCLANCTTLCYGRALENNYPPPVTRIVNANRWHTVVNTSGGWTKLDYINGMLLYAGDIIEYSENTHVNSYGQVVEDNHVGMIEYQGTNPTQSSSWYESRDESLSLQAISDYFQSTERLQYRFYHSTSLGTENAQSSGGNQPKYVLRYTGSTPPEPPEPTTTPDIEISPSSASGTIISSGSYVDFTFNITITGIPNGESASGGNTYPGLSRVYNTGWSYSSYTVDGVTYRSATKTQTLRYERESGGAYTTTKYMYFDLDFSNGSINSTTPMYITVQRSSNNTKLLIAMRKKRRPKHILIKI